jgi:hypothetical protein
VVVTLGQKRRRVRTVARVNKPVSRKDGLSVGGSVENQMFIGIDVFKARLDVALRPDDESFVVTNN